MERQQRRRGESGSKTGETRKTLSLVCWQPVKLTNRKKGKMYDSVYVCMCTVLFVATHGAVTILYFEYPHYHHQIILRHKSDALYKVRRIF